MKIKNFFLSLFFPPLKKVPLPENPSFLIVSTTGLGDSLWALPSIILLRKHYPNSRISLLTTSLGQEIFKEEKAIDEIILFEQNFFSLLSRYRKCFDIIFFFHASQRATIPFCRLLAPSWMVGTKGMQKGLDHLFSHIVPWTKKHEVQRRMEQLALLGIKEEKGGFSFSLTSAEKEKGKEKLSSLKSPIIVLHVGAKDHYKCWPAENFLLLAEKIEKESLGTPIFTRAPGDPLLSTSFPIFDNLPLREFAALLAASDLLITNDTGPMHLMSSLHKPLIALFGPTDPKVCGPLSPKAHLIQTNRTCLTCRKRKCQDPFCLRQIPIWLVLKKTKELLSGTCKDFPTVEYSPICTLKWPSS